jgi:hypothetical protein
MKKLILLGMMVVTGLSMSSCEKDIIENYYSVPSKSFVYTIRSNQWTDQGYRISRELAIPELTSYYIRQGGVSVSMSFDKENSYDILPATFDGVAYSVRYSAGKVTIFAEDPLIDENIEVPIPNEVQVKIILTEADFVE